MAKTIATPVGKAVWPKLVTPDTRFNPEGVYSCKLHVSEDAFKAVIQPMYDAEYNRYCIAKGKDKLKKAAEPVKITEEGDYEISAKQAARSTSKSGETYEFTVALYDSDVKPITDKPNIGNGSKVKLSVQPYFWHTPTLGFGYSLKLKAAQIIELIEYEADGQVFGKEAGGFTQGESFESVIIEDEVSETPNF